MPLFFEASHFMWNSTKWLVTRATPGRSLVHICIFVSTTWCGPLFVFSIGGLKQNVNSLLTPVSGTAVHALSCGSLHFVLHGSRINRLFQRFLLAVEENQPIRKCLKKLPWRAKPRLPCEKAWKAESETDVKSDLAFCFGSLIEKIKQC